MIRLFLREIVDPALPGSASASAKRHRTRLAFPCVRRGRFHNWDLLQELRTQVFEVIKLFRLRGREIVRRRN